MGGQWEVSGKHLPSHIPFIHRPFTSFKGGWEVFSFCLSPDIGIKFLRPAYEKFVP